ncbi:hypothetical protein ACH5RR_007058 [Cinchona calisaya]|uniref:Glucan endo-1,3-beta-D-glucosidase n=1 Tax=Cinchona calisaya TaxID=153742 RepID=A0ABD3AQP8_9GENT
MDIELSANSDFVGVCYGTNGDNLPPPSEAVALCKMHNIKKMRIFTPDEEVLSALKGSEIELMLGVPDDDIEKLADPSFARIWVQKYVIDYSPDVKFRYISIGDEIMPHKAETALQATFVLTAMQNIYDSISFHGIENQVKVSITIGMRILGRSYPPSAGACLAEVSSYMCQIIKFLKDTNAPLLLNVDPFWSYVITPVNHMSISYALFTASSPVVKDRQYKYKNLFVAKLDAMYWALERAGAPSLEIVVCSVGWPSNGSERGASYKNAATFYSNLIKNMKLGTPRRPRRPIETYLSSLFDENKSGERESTKHMGLFFANKNPKYSII